MSKTFLLLGCSVAKMQLRVKVLHVKTLRFSTNAGLHGPGGRNDEELKLHPGGL